MSIRTYNKDHRKEHAGVSLAAPISIVAPTSDDPMVFWTHHKEPCEVNLHRFSLGQEKYAHPFSGGAKFIPFTGRSQLIRQLVPAIKEALLYTIEGTVDSYMNSLRAWWRVLDKVEAEAEKVNQPMTRVDDVRLLTNIHSAAAHSSGMNRHLFGTFRSLVDSTRKALNLRETYWESPEDAREQKRIPSQEQRNALRFAVRNKCRRVLERWALADRLNQSDTMPDDPHEAEIWRNVKYMRHIQKKTGKTLPKPDDLDGEIEPWALNVRGNFKLPIRESVFPNYWDATAVWHQCLLNTGWNPSTLTSMDITQNILTDHFKDAPHDPHRRFVLSPQTYELVGNKQRAGGKEQFVTGQWKTLDGPGHLIKTYLERVEPLREVLKQQLAQEQVVYQQIDAADYKARTAQFEKVKYLEQGVRSVWLCVNRHGNVSWIDNKLASTSYIEGKPTTYLDDILHSLNKKRSSENLKRVGNNETSHDTLLPIPHVAPKDFRLWFADYVYRSSRGNILHVKKALNHSQLGTSIGYVDNNILNQEANSAARQFLSILVQELDSGRVDLTILSHLYRYGVLTPEQEELLAKARILPKSRMNVACKDTSHPPPHIKAVVGEKCDVQRCLLCLENAVLLPESLDGIAMRVEELRALQCFLSIESWIDDKYDIELKNNLMALRKFDLNKGMDARNKWAKAIASGAHYVPGIPFIDLPELLNLV